MVHGNEAVSADSQRAAPLRMSAGQALFEAQRCLYCFDAPCVQACPVHIDVPGFIKRLAEENYEGAGQLLFQANPLATVCGVVCPTADLCEGACVLHGLGQRPIRIGALQYFVASRFHLLEPATEAASAYRAAVIGAGPSGLGCAVTLRRLGCQVSLYERAPHLGGLASQVIPAYRLPQSAVAHDVALLEGLGIDYHLGVEIDRRGMERILGEHDAVFVGTGLQGSRKLPVPGAELAGVVQALDFLGQARLHGRGQAPPPALGETVAIVGGGNVALDAALTAKQLGAEQAIVLYRRSLEEMPAWPSEYVEAASAGIEFRWLSTVRAIRGVRGTVQAIEVQPMRRTDAQADGRRGVEPDPRSPSYLLRCDSVLLALGQALDSELAAALDLSLTEEGTIRVDPESFQTDNPRVFAAGEAARGASTVVASLATGMAAGRAMQRWLSR